MNNCNCQQIFPIRPSSVDKCQYLQSHLCQEHHQKIIGLCYEKSCAYNNRWLCQQCMFKHSKCEHKIQKEDIRFISTIDYIINSKFRKTGNLYFFHNSRIQSIIDKIFDFVEKKYKFDLHSLELRYLQSFKIRFKNLIDVLQQQGDISWAQNILHMHSNSKNNFINLNEHDLEKAVYFFNQKQNFDSLICCELEETFKKIQKLFDSGLKKTMTQLNIDNSVVYDMKTTVKNAELTVKQYEQNLKMEELFNQFSESRLNIQLRGHSTDSIITSILEVNQDQLLTASQDGLIIGWDYNNFEILFRIQVKGNVNTLAYIAHKQEEYLLAAGSGPIYVYNYKNVKMSFKLGGHAQNITKLLVFDQVGVMSSSYDGQIKFWNVLTRQEIGNIFQCEGPVMDLANVGKYVVSVAMDGRILIFDPLTRRVKRIIQNKYAVYSISMLNQNQFLISTSNGLIKIIHLDKDQPIEDINVCSQLIWKVLAINQNLFLCYSQDSYLYFIQRQNLSKIKRKQVSKGDWETMLFNQQKQILIIPNGGLIGIYQ